MKLLKLSLTNFQGIPHAEFDFDGQSASIYGTNGTGKTTVFNAMTYLLFDKASTGERNYTPKTTDHDGNDVHFLNHIVEAVFQKEDGSRITLKKDYHEKYKTKRGASEKLMDGHGVDYFVDGVPVKEKQFNNMLCFEFGTIEQLKMLTMPDYFCESLDWRSRREILLQLCGDVTDEDVISSCEELGDLKKLLLKPGSADQYYSVDEYKLIANATKTKLNKQLQEIPGRIDEAQRAIPDTEGMELEAIQNKLDALYEEKSGYEAKKVTALSQDRMLAAINVKISEAEAGLKRAEAEYLRQQSEEGRSVYSEIDRLMEERAKLRDRLLDLEKKLRQSQKELETLNDTRKRLMEEYRREKDRQWNDEDNFCPTCKRKLPIEEIKKAKEEFYLQKSSRLEQINQKGKTEASKDLIASAEKEIQTNADGIRQTQKEIEQMDDRMDKLSSNLRQRPKFEFTDTYNQIFTEIHNLTLQKQNQEELSAKIVQKYDDQLAALQAKINEQKNYKTMLEITQGQQRRIQDLQEQEQDLAGKFEEVQKGIYLCDLFVREKVSLLTSKINSRFRTVRFRLVQNLGSGGIQEVCEALVLDDSGNHTLFSSANKAAKLKAGLEVIHTLSAHWNRSMPVFVDNAESVVRLKREVDQLIRLVVSEKDLKLRTVIEEQEES